MGLCASSRQNGQFLKSSRTVMVILSNGKLQEFKQPIRAQKLLSLNPNCFVCCSETMNLDSFPVQMAEDDELQVGQLYFLMPVTKSRTLITLQDLCTLAIKASEAINSGSASAERGRAVVASVPLVDDKCAVRFWGRIPSRGGAIGVGGSAEDHVASARQII